jgi:DNA-binding NtrC family response regulator
MNKVKILAVDDEEKVLKRIKTALYDYDVATELSSVKAMERIQKEKYNIFIVDYQMPEIDGIELLEEIKHKYRKKPYIGIFCTAYGTIHLFKEEMMEELFSFYLEKPYEDEDLHYVLDQAVIRLKNEKKNVKHWVFR